MGIVQDNEKTQDLKEAEEIKQEAEVSQKKSNQSAKNEGEDKLKRKKKVNRFNSLFQSNIPQLKKMILQEHKNSKSKPKRFNSHYGGMSSTTLNNRNKVKSTYAGFFRKKKKNAN